MWSRELDVYCEGWKMMLDVYGEKERRERRGKRSDEGNNVRELFVLPVLGGIIMIEHVVQ